MKKTVAVFTSSRADYGLLRPLLRRLQKSPVLSPRVGAGGSHFLPALGNTYKEILSDGFKIAFKTPPPAGDDALAAARAAGRGLEAAAQGLSRLRAAGLVVLGDRYEAFAAAAAAWSLGIPVAHVHGGEITEGSADEGWRHAVTKLSHFHFTAAEAYRRRVIRMGEDPVRVFNAGALGVENARAARRVPRPELERALGFAFGPRTVLVTLHPPTREPNFDADAVLSGLAAVKDATLLFTGSNADAGGRALWRRIRAFAARRPGARAWESLGADRYLALMSQVDAVAGNSSSGIIEAPALGVPVVDIGARQRGRIASAGVLRCAVGKAPVARALARALSPAFRRAAARARNPYGEGRASEKIARVLERVLLKPAPAKSFHEVRHEKA